MTIMACMQLVDVPVPKPKKGEVLVKFEAAGVNTVDWKIQGGLLKHILPLKFPHIPGTDISGEMVSVGPGVENFIPGDKIISCVGVLVRKIQVLAPSSRVVQSPRDIPICKA
ncbi:unnamed protein product [Sphagnum tenellum]